MSVLEGELFNSTNELPEGWVIAKLPEFANLNMGQSPPGKTYNNNGNGMPFFQGKTDFSDRYPTVRVWCSEPKKVAHAGDVLISIRAPVGPTNVANQTCAIGRGLSAITPLDGISTELILYALRERESELALSGTGSTFMAINKGDLEQMEFPLPPLAEQKRIVAKVEELLARVNAARERLAKVPVLIKRFRQSVLAAACSGKLTEDWRERRDFHKTSTLSELPEGWLRRPLKTVCDGFQYGSSKKSSKEGEMPVLRMGNIQEGKIDWENLVFTSDQEEINKFLLKPNTVLFNRTNSPELVGKTAIYRGEQPAIFAGYLIRILHGKQLNPEYVNLCLNSLEFKEYCLKVRTDGVSQSNINAQKLAAYEIPWCDVEEQKEIVRRIEALSKLADSIEEKVQAASIRAEKLTQAILVKAFRGELVPTEAELARKENRDYEPASVLLERIKKEYGVRQQR